ncbi:DMT family transporter [Flavobacterium oreochromis]|uniref:DMT family transporter n=1 Tax=Flavobacterium oreochromis TaxID=2906078 RepID=A0ABW8P633_9FLAO|nr:DMT family transporter [Flavobacterium oreochromis]OWP77728.1 EamA family transporter [Flavobacterium oreochromis]POR24460.1 EamA family transporter [Flavobacterium columnare]QYS85779.1 DMT family transporter [Flavobacterium oreochromis]
MLKDKTFTSYLHLHFIVFVWGFTAILGALITLEALPLVWFRMSIASIFILIYVFFAKISLKISFQSFIRYLLAGLVIALHWYTFFEAIKVANISITLACLSTGAFFTSILEPIFFKRKIILYEVVLGLMVIIGLYFIFKVEMIYLQGILLALTSAFLSASFSIINGKLAKNDSSTIISFYELLGGVLFFSVFLLCSGSFNYSFFKISMNDLLWMAILSSVCTAYAFIASVQVMKYLSPYTVMLTINLEPIYGIILALWVFGDKEKMNSQFYLGAFIILTTVILNGILKNKSKIKR